MEENKTISDHIVQNFLKHFKSGNLSLKIKPRTGGQALVDYDTLKQHVEKNASTQKFPEELRSIDIKSRVLLYKLKKYSGALKRFFLSQQGRFNG